MNWHDTWISTIDSEAERSIMNDFVLSRKVVFGLQNSPIFICFIERNLAIASLTVISLFIKYDNQTFRYPFYPESPLTYLISYRVRWTESDLCRSLAIYKIRKLVFCAGVLITLTVNLSSAVYSLRWLNECMILRAE